MPTPVFIIKATTLKSAPNQDPRFGANIILTPALNPVLVDRIVRKGAIQTGPFSFMLGTGNAQNNYQSNIKDVLDVIGSLTFDSKKGESGVTLIATKPKALLTRSNTLRSRYTWTYSHNNIFSSQRLHRAYYPTSLATDQAKKPILSVLSSNTAYYLRFYTNWGEYREAYSSYTVGHPSSFIENSPAYLGNADIFLPRRSAHAITLGEVLQVLHLHSDKDIPDLRILDETDHRQIEQFLTNPEQAFLIWENKESYGNPYIYLGNYPKDTSTAAAARLRKQITKTLPTDSGTMGNIPLSSLKKLPQNACDPLVQDLIDMLNASPVKDKRLRSFQQEAVARHLATRFGYVNLCATGSGKSVMAAAAMARRGKNTPRYRGLIITEASVRSQFVSEIKNWFPQAHIVSITGTKDLRTLTEALQDDRPLVAITSYTLLGGFIGNTQRTLLSDSLLVAVENENEDYDDDNKTSVTSSKTKAVSRASQLSPTEKLFLETTWHDLIADEADVLRNSASKQSRALWHIRQNAEIAVALTATPVTKTADDLGKIIAWTRNTPILPGQSLTRRYDFSNNEDTLRFGQDYQAVLFRYDKTAFQEELPFMRPPTLCVLEPSKEEVALSHAARQGLKEVYLNLLDKIDELAQANPDSEMYSLAQAELQAARGAWLGGTQLARLAASDPSALLTSRSIGAQMLQLDNWVQPAIEHGSTKRKWVINAVIDRVSAGGRVLLFTEFSSVARMLVTHLEASGLRVGLIEGGGGKKRDQTVTLYQNGLLDVLVSTSAGQKGLNLQNTTTLIHYDLPWIPLGLVQRNGRVERIGSSVKDVETIYVSLRGTIEEKIVSLIVSRAIEQAQILDTSRGIVATDSEFGRLAMSLGVGANTMELDSRQSHLLELTKALIEEFPEEEIIA